MGLVKPAPDGLHNRSCRTGQSLIAGRRCAVAPASWTAKLRARWFSCRVTRWAVNSRQR